MRSVRLQPPAKAVPLIVGAVAAVLMFIRLFVPHPVGMANNGDAQRLICQIGGDADAPPKPTAKWFFVRLFYPYAGHTADCGSYPSTQTPVLWITSFIHRHILGRPGVIDMRELAVEYCLLTGVAIAVFAYVLRSVKPLPRLALLCGLFLVLSEAVFADYAASPYSEPSALEGVLIIAIAALAFVDGNRGGMRRAAYLVAWFGALFAVGSKNEMVTLAIPLALLLGTQKFQLRRLSWRFASRIVPALCVLSILATAVWSLNNEVPLDKKVNFANEVTVTIMPLSGDPSAVATGLGLPASWGKYSGSNWWSKKSMYTDPQYPKYEAKFTDSNLARYLAEHPAIAAKTLASGSGQYLLFRETNLGTYPMDAGYAPESQECRDCVLLDVSHSLAWTGFTGIVLYWLACIAAAAALWRTSFRGTRRRAFAVTGMTLIGITLVQYVTAVYGEGVEVVKHLSVGLFAASLAPVWLAAGACFDRGARPLRLRRRRSAQDDAARSEPAEFSGTPT